MPEFVNPALIESVLSTVFDYYKKRLITTPSDRANFDFVLEDEKYGKTAIEVKSQSFNINTILKIAERLYKNRDIKRFILITPEKPDSKSLALFDRYVKPAIENLNWYSLKDFLKIFYDLDVNDSNDLAQLQIAAITSKYDIYNKEVIGNRIPIDISTELLERHLAEVKEGKFTIPDNLISLRRQFPDSILANLDTEYEKLLIQLHVGQKFNDAIIVLTDIKNFSNIVSSADPDELNEAMNKYYSNARDLVFKYNGVLVQFVGDAVLAIFNYPKRDQSAYINTAKFCSELILLGRATFDLLLSKMDQAINTGTRIGVSNGAIYTLNISKDGIEITFIGDKINFASRLEKNCDVDGILLSNRFYTKFAEECAELANTFGFVRKDLEPSDAKGQIAITRAWQIVFNDIQKIVNWQK